MTLGLFKRRSKHLCKGQNSSLDWGLQNPKLALDDLHYHRSRKSQCMWVAASVQTIWLRDLRVSTSNPLPRVRPLLQNPTAAAMRATCLFIFRSPECQFNWSLMAGTCESFAQLAWMSAPMIRREFSFCVKAEPRQISTG